MDYRRAYWRQAVRACVLAQQQKSHDSDSSWYNKKTLRAATDFVNGTGKSTHYKDVVALEAAPLIKASQY